jgi:hypothetical protein
MRMVVTKFPDTLVNRFLYFNIVFNKNTENADS